MVDAGFENQKELTKMQLDNQKEIAEMQTETQKEIAGIQSATSRQNTKDQVYAQNEMLAYQQKESTARVASVFFSSRRRHTRWTGDWSSDVCSSDLRCQSRHHISLKSFPVISLGTSTPRRFRIVGPTSRNEPPCRRAFASSPTTRNGTGLVVCAVCGPPDVGSIISSQLPWSAVTSRVAPRCSALAITRARH